MLDRCHFFNFLVSLSRPVERPQAALPARAKAPIVIPLKILKRGMGAGVGCAYGNPAQPRVLVRSDNGCSQRVGDFNRGNYISFGPCLKLNSQEQTRRRAD